MAYSAGGNGHRPGVDLARPDHRRRPRVGCGRTAGAHRCCDRAAASARSDGLRSIAGRRSRGRSGPVCLQHLSTNRGWLDSARVVRAAPERRRGGSSGCASTWTALGEPRDGADAYATLEQPGCAFGAPLQSITRWWTARRSHRGGSGAAPGLRTRRVAVLAASRRHGRGISSREPRRSSAHSRFRAVSSRLNRASRVARRRRAGGVGRRVATPRGRRRPVRRLAGWTLPGVTRLRISGRAGGAAGARLRAHRAW